MPLAGRPMVAHVIDRARAIAGVHVVVAAVPDLPEDDELAAACERSGAMVVRGPTDDVLSRYVRAADAAEADVVVRITADCPLLSPLVSSLVLSRFDDCDYASNTMRRTFPRGLDTEVLSGVALRAADEEATDPVEREHVTPYIYRRPRRFRLVPVVGDDDLSHLRWTVDSPDDMAFAIAVFDALGPSFEVRDVLELLERRPEIGAINRSTPQKALS